MVRLVGPLMSKSAAGKLGNDLAFRQGRTGTHAYALGNVRRANARPPSADQIKVREAYSAAAEAWRALSPEARAAFNRRAARSRRSITGWALFFQIYSRLGPNPPPCDDGAYTPPPGDAIVFPGVSCVSDNPYTPPPGDAIVFP